MLKQFLYTEGTFENTFSTTIAPVVILKLFVSLHSTIEIHLNFTNSRFIQGLSVIVKLRALANSKLDLVFI